MRFGFIDLLRPRVLPAVASSLLLSFASTAQLGSAAPLPTCTNVLCSGTPPTTTAQATSSPGIPTQGLVARYLFNGNALDSAGGHNGAIHGVTLTSNRFGNGSSAYSFNGTDAYVEIPDANAFSVSTTGQLSISVWMRPGTLTFPDSEPETRMVNGTSVAVPKEQQYVYWLGKGQGDQQEWAFRMYNFDDPKDDPVGYDNRSNRTSFYLFNLTGGLGAGSYVQEPVTAGTWYHYVAVADMRTDTITLYKNGVLKKQVPFMNSVYNIHPQNGTSPVRVGTLDPGARDTSFFKGAIDNISIYNRALSVAEINQLFNDPTP